jgi:hypothetical protein
MILEQNLMDIGATHLVFVINIPFNMKQGLKRIGGRQLVRFSEENKGYDIFVIIRKLKNF